MLIKAHALAVVVIGVLLGQACGDSSASAPTPSQSAPKRLLIVTTTTGFRHSSIPVAESVLTRLADDSGVFAASFCRTTSDVAQLLSAAGLATIDGVFFANTTGNLGIPDLAAFLSWIRAGHPFIGTHSATDTYHDSPEYLEMIGAEFATHGNQTTVDIRIDDRGHPATSPLPSPFRIFDEIYEFRSNPRGRVTVLVSLDRHPDDGHPEAGQPGDFPLAWHRQYGSGRVFYTALGHREEVWNDTRFQQHLLGAIRWAFGL